ncbi:MAG TPA: PQQ-dependent sugar dehydrogenase, partial [Gemmatimonadales bacterium]|nr:PQQ-dependent sugar dehydrogenase [Gemmatimonadales bacterium]
MNPSFSIRRPAMLALAPLVLLVATRVSPLASPKCDTDNGGLVLPEGFCATLVASQLGPVRQLAVRPNGDLYAALSGKPGDNTGGVLAFRDRDGDGKPDERASFGPGGGNDVKLHDGYLYFALNDRVVRYRLEDGQLQPAGKEEVVVTGLPNDGGHQAKSLAFGSREVMYVNIGSKTNSCQKTDRLPASPGHDPCAELQRRGGIWRFSADRLNQRFADGRRFATGLRNAMALAIQPGTGALFAAVHGRDQLSDNWGFSNEVNANNPAEELVYVEENGDYGWPYCYYSNQYKKKVLAPEYGGDGQKIGRCGTAKDPIMVFPGHWAPMALAFYTSDTFGPNYRGGLFVAFRGSWNRDPLPQEGYRVVFVPFANGRPQGEYSTFATEKTGPTSLRATGVAVGPDGSLYISADQNGKIWKVT